MKAELVEFGVFKFPGEDLPVALGLFELKGKKHNHPVDGVSFKVAFDIDTMDRELFVHDLKDSVAIDMDIDPSDVVFNEVKVLDEMRLFKWMH